MTPENCAIRRPFRCPACGKYAGEELGFYAPIGNDGQPAIDLCVAGSWLAIYCDEMCYDRHSNTK